MAVKPARLAGPIQLGTTISTLYTSAALTSTAISNAIANNQSAGVVTFTVHVVPSGDSATASNQVVSAIPLAAGESMIIGNLLNQVLGPGDSIQALASAATSINVLLSGNKIT